MQTGRILHGTTQTSSQPIVNAFISQIQIFSILHLQTHTWQAVDLLPASVDIWNASKNEDNFPGPKNASDFDTHLQFSAGPSDLQAGGAAPNQIPNQIPNPPHKAGGAKRSLQHPPCGSSKTHTQGMNFSQSSLKTCLGWHPRSWANQERTN